VLNESAPHELIDNMTLATHRETLLPHGISSITTVNEAAYDREKGSFGENDVQVRGMTQSQR
jgi:hypothetical protein